MKVRLKSNADTDSRQSLQDFLQRQPQFDRLQPLGSDTMEVADELLPVLREFAANFGVQVQRAEDMP